MKKLDEADSHAKKAHAARERYIERKSTIR